VVVVTYYPTSQVPGEAAWHYGVELGMKVLPLWPGIKCPFSSKKGSLCYRHPEPHPPLLGRGFTLDEVGSSDPDQIAEWWLTCPLAGVGVVTGRRSRLLVLDADRHGKGDGVWTLEQYLAECHDEGFELLDVPVATTARDGRHLWFRIDERDAPSTTRWFLPDVEALGSDHWVAAPPTLTEDGAYNWKEWCEPPPAPDWLLAELRGKSLLGASSARERVIDRAGVSLGTPHSPMPWDDEFMAQGLGIWSGSRHIDAVWLVVRTWHRTHDYEVTVGFLRRVWQATEDAGNGRPGLWGEIERILAWKGVGR
jgi:Bifunctional DNA primase/polymerase, N-terminal